MQRLYADDHPTVKALCDRLPEPAEARCQVFFAALWLSAPPQPDEDEAALSRALQACAAAVEGRWEPGAPGELPKLRRGNAWRPLPHLVGSSAFHSDPTLGLCATQPGGEGGFADAGAAGGAQGSDSAAESASDVAEEEEQSDASSSELSAESSELTDSEHAGASSSSYEAVTDDEALRRRREEAGTIKGMIEARIVHYLTTRQLSATVPGHTSEVWPRPPCSAHRASCAQEGEAASAAEGAAPCVCILGAADADTACAAPAAAAAAAVSRSALWALK